MYQLFSDLERIQLVTALLAQADGTFTPQMPHPLGICTGNCPYHTAFTHDYDLFYNGGGWGDWNETLFEEDHSRETPEQTAARLKLIAKRHAEALVEAEVIRQHGYAAELAFRQSIGVKKVPRGAPPPPPRKLIEQPCKWLYAVPGKDGVFSNSPCAECWGHEYTDAKGVKLAPHKCLYIHPNQPEWKAEWNALLMTRDRWRAPRPAAGGAPEPEIRFAALAPRPAPRAAAAPAAGGGNRKKLPSGPSGW